VFVACGVARAFLLDDRATQPSATPQLELGAALVKTGLSLGAVLVLLTIGLRLLKRWNQACANANPTQRIEVLESRRLEAKRSLHIVSVEGQRWLVASCEGGMSLTALGAVESTPIATAVPPPAPRAQRFSELFFGRARGVTA
jgi:flagellar biogenesis protein FliO